MVIMDGMIGIFRKYNNGNDLSNHLLSGLNPAGVPKGLENTAFPFNYNDRLPEKNN